MMKNIDIAKLYAYLSILVIIIIIVIIIIETVNFDCSLKFIERVYVFIINFVNEV